MTGYVRLHRSLIGHPSFRNDAEAMAFAWMIAKASWRPTRVRYKGHSITLERGQLAVSQRDMAFNLDRDKAWIERLWKRLKREAMIKVGVEAGVAVITICNYGEYQGSTEDREAQGEALGEAEARQRRGTEQEVNKGRSKEGAKAPSRRKLFPVPSGVSLDQWEAFSKQRKKPLNNRSYLLLCNKLHQFAANGHAPGDVIDLAIERGWETVFEPHAPKGGSAWTQ